MKNPSKGNTMAKLTRSHRRAFNRQLRTRAILEQKLEQELRRTFRRYTSTVTEFVRATGIFYFPKALKEEITATLLKHYHRTARQFFSFTRDLNKKNWSTVKIETKSWQYKSTAVPKRVADSIDARMRVRLSEIFDKIASERASSIAATTEIEIRRYITKVESDANKENITLPREQMAKIVRDMYFDRINSRIHPIGVTETTFAIEKTKVVEVEETLDQLDEDQLVALAESGNEAAQEELEAILAELSGEEGISSEDVLAAGGALALLAALSITKTWVATLDSHTREDHADADGQEVALDEPFNVGGEDLEYPGDESGDISNTINCRCSVLYGI